MYIVINFAIIFYALSPIYFFIFINVLLFIKHKIYLVFNKYFNK